MSRSRLISGFTALGCMLFLHAPRALFAQPATLPAEQSALTSAAASAAQGDTLAALQQLRRQASQHPGWTRVLYAQARLEYQLHLYSEARRTLLQLTHSEPRHGAAWTLLGLADFALRDFHLALTHLEQGKLIGVPAEYGLEDAARYQIVLCLLLDSRFEQALLRAEEFMEDPLSHTPKRDPDLILALGLGSLRWPLLPKTARAVLSPSRLQMAQLAGEARLSAALTTSGDTAAELYSRLFNHYPAEPGLHFAYGSLLSALKQWQPAEHQFQLELKINSNSIPAQLGIVRCAVERADPAAGLPLARKCVKQGPCYFMAHYYLGRLLLYLPEATQGSALLNEAVAALETAAQLEPQSPLVRFALSQAYRRAGRLADFEREIAVFEQLKASLK